MEPRDPAQSAPFPTIRAALLASTKPPSAAAYMMQGYSPYMANLKALMLTPDEIYVAMELERTFPQTDWPQNCPPLTPRGLFDAILGGRLFPDGDFASLFCMMTGVAPDALVIPGTISPVRPEIIEAAIFFEQSAGDDEGDLRQRMRLFMGEQVMKARACAAHKLRPYMPSHERMLESCETFYRQNLDLTLAYMDGQSPNAIEYNAAYEDETPPITVLLEQCDYILSLYGQNLKGTAKTVRQSARRVKSAGGRINPHLAREAFRQYRVGNFSLNNFKEWRRADDTQAFLRMEANSRHILTIYNYDALGIPAPDTGIRKILLQRRQGPA